MMAEGTSGDGNEDKPGQAPEVSIRDNLPAGGSQLVQNGGSLSPFCGFRRRFCSICSRPKDDFERYVEFIKYHDDGNETRTQARALFDTGNPYRNMIRLDFALSLNSDTFEYRDDITERLPFLRRLAAKLWRMLGKPHRIHGGSLTECRTIDGSPVEFVGILRSARWFCEDTDDKCNKISFNNKFETSEFYVVKKLMCDVIFSLDTINELGLLEGKCSAGLFPRKPTPAGPGDYEKQQRDRDKQAKEKKELDKARKEKEKKAAAKKT